MRLIDEDLMDAGALSRHRALPWPPLSQDADTSPLRPVKLTKQRHTTVASILNC